MRLRRRESGAHRIHGNMARSKGPPCLDSTVPFILVEALNTDPGINAEVIAIPAGLFEIFVELLDVPLGKVVRWSTRRHPTIAEPCGTPEGGLCSTAEPDRDGTLNGHRIDA